jgi:hypothetical protein
VQQKKGQAGQRRGDVLAEIEYGNCQNKDVKNDVKSANGGGVRRIGHVLYAKYKGKEGGAVKEYQNEANDKEFKCA